MDLRFSDFSAGIFNPPEPPCLSLYQATSRYGPDKKGDLIRYGNLMKSLEESLRQKYSHRDVAPLLEPFHRLAEDRNFWSHTLDGLAVLGAPGLFRAYRLQRSVPELTVVAESFHLKPLVRIVQSADTYQILGLSRQRVRFFEGNRDALDEVALDPAVPRSRDEIYETKAAPAAARAHAAAPGGRPGSASSGVVVGLSSRSEFEEKETEGFFRAVDRAVLDHHSKPSDLPLLLLALPENISEFRRISQNPYIMQAEIAADPDSLTVDELRERAWRVVEPTYLARLAGLIEQFGTASARNLGEADLSGIARSAAAGRVRMLLVEADRRVPGRLDRTSGAIEFNELADPEVDDLLDDIGEMVLRTGGEIVIVPTERMPTESGLAAIYRF